MGRVAGHDVAPPWQGGARRSELAGREGQHDGHMISQYGEGSGKGVDRVAIV